MGIIPFESLDSLPYIDADITQDERDRADRLIRRELPPQHAHQEHPSMSALTPMELTSTTESKPPTLMQQEIRRRKEQGTPMAKGIDVSRYEAPDGPDTDNEDLADHQAALRNAYTLSTYLAGRRTNLELLDEHGKNAWLMGNAELEAVLKNLESQLADIKEQTNGVNRTRKAAQEASRGELVGLTDSWRQGVGKIIEVQVATIQLREELARRRRTAAAGGVE